MAFPTERNYKLFSIIITGLVFQADILYGHITPKIFHDDEHIYDALDNFTILCEGSWPLSWTFPNQSSSSTYEIHDVESKHGYMFASLFQLNNASFLDTGYYECIETNPKNANNQRRSEVYIYVRDDEHLTVLTDIATIGYSSEDREVVIPCRPTSPDVTVRLMKNNINELGYYWEKVATNVWLPDGVLVRFSNFVGFTLESGEEGFSSDGIFECTFERDGIEETKNAFLIFQAYTTSIAQPTIIDQNMGHTIIGETIHLQCNLVIGHENNFSITWKFPPNSQYQPARINQSDYVHLNHTYYYKTLAIYNATKLDAGNYTCLVEDHNHNKNNQSIFVPVYDHDEHFINLTEENGVYNITQRAGEKEIKWRIDVHAHPITNLNLTWFDNHNEIIYDERKRKYDITSTSTETVFSIHNIQISDFGNYTLRAENGYAMTELKVFLHVTDKPTVQIESDEFHFLNRKSAIKCLAAGYPEPTVMWYFTPSCDQNATTTTTTCTRQSLEPVDMERRGLQVISTIELIAREHGIVECAAHNEYGDDSDNRTFYVTDVENGFNLWGSDNLIDDRQTAQRKVAVGDRVELNCAASASDCANIYLSWSQSGVILNNSDDDYVIESSQTIYSKKSRLIIPSIGKNQSAEYSCIVNCANTKERKNANITIEVSDPEPPRFTETNFQEKLVVDFPESLELKCYFAGIPRPTITWYKDGRQLKPDNQRVEFIDNGQCIRINRTINTDDGEYVCKLHNRMGDVEQKMRVINKNKVDNTPTIIVMSILGIALLSTLVCLAGKICKERKLERVLRETGLHRFEAGNIDGINPELCIDDQADLLPYDKKWEIPRENLKMGKQLGSGAFGVVMKAEARGIIEGEDTTTVAVKMVKPNADHAYIKALASELKIMVHLGKHINVVNLLGACTKNIAKRELLVIVEYCQYGNLQNYIFRHRQMFIDQIDKTTGKMDFSHGPGDFMDRSISFSSNRSYSVHVTPKTPNINYVALKFAKQQQLQMQKQSSGIENKLMSDYRGANYTGDSTTTDTTFLPPLTPVDNNGPDEAAILSNNSSVQPEWRSNYRGDYKDNTQYIYTKDLLAWSFQVARAMEYLSSKKVLHGDLAARNILLTDNNVVKVCDFGLAKSMYKNNNYKKRGNVPLPVKWMAIESISDRVFSTQSDVWSFGIVLWEFFSLAKNPYPGMEADENLYKSIMNGYRMDCPQYATKDIYRIMVDCWKAKPQDRPSFTQLGERLGSMLEESVKQFYIDLNDPYLVMNTECLKEGEDYLAMFSPPDYEKIASPMYVNDTPSTIINGLDPQNGYMCMKPSLIFSPREVDDDDVFTFEVPLEDQSRVDSENGELIVRGGGGENESDLSDNVVSCATTNSISNPTYRFIEGNETNECCGDDDESVVQSSKDNYVNIPKSKHTYVNKQKQPSSTDKQYVNAQTRDWESLRI